MVKFIFNKFILSYLILLIPFLNFLNSNVNEVNLVIYNQLLIYLLFSIIFQLFGSSVIKFIFFKKIYFQEILLIFSIGFYLLFLYRPIKNFFFDTLNFNGYAILSLLTITSIFFIVAIIIFFRHKILTRFICIYFIIFFFINLLTFLFESPINYFNQNKINNNVGTQYFNSDEISLIKNKDNKNIYYVMLDQATSIEKYASYYNRDKDEILANLKKIGLSNVANTQSSNDTTPHTLSSMFNLTQPLNELSNPNHTFSYDFFPVLISKSRLIRNPKPMLLQALENINYDFIWVGNHFADCDFFNPDYCLYLKPFKNTFDKLFKLNYYIFDSFSLNTPFKAFYARFINHKGFDIDLGDIFYENDGIRKFLDNVNKLDINNKNYFFFIHHMMPHTPFIFNPDCSRRTSNTYYDKEFEKVYAQAFISDFDDGYDSNYQCMIKRIKELTNYININDPEAIVIFQADHGRYFIKQAKISFAMNTWNTEFTNKYDEKILSERLDILSLFKVNKECEKYLGDKMDNINAVRLALSCATDTEVKLVEPKIYYISGFADDYGKVYRFK
tara:strand:+ start:184 stop:1857 length:1674 start_codon:yes stop_codon:yes gene_type:complete